MREVTLEAYTPIRVALKAGLICTASEDKIEKYDPEIFLSKLVKAGHESVIEHINYTFTIECVSRALLQELARHRHISLSVQSTRWALNKTFDNQHLYSPNEIVERKDEVNPFDYEEEPLDSNGSIRIYKLKIVLSKVV